MIAPAKISLYRLKTMVEGKLYISSELVEVLGASSRATLEFRGRLYSVSAYRPSKGSKALKLYLPREVVERVLEAGAEGAVIEVEDGRVHLIRLIRFCRICKRPTAAPDGICTAQHFHKEGVCRRCGEVIRKEILCDHCVKIYAQLCGLGSWLDPEDRGMGLKVEDALALAAPLHEYCDYCRGNNHYDDGRYSV